MLRKNRYFNPTFIALFILVIWDALKAYLGLFAPIMQFAILFPVVAIGIFDNLNNKLMKTILSRPASIWLIWILYVLVNTFLVTGYYAEIEQSAFVFISSIIIAYLFFVFIIISKSDTQALINVLIFSYACRLIMSLIFDTFEPDGVENVARYGIDLNANIIAIGSLFIIFLILLKKISFSSLNKIDYIFAAIALFSIFLTASRKTYIALILLAMGFVYIVRSRYLIKNVMLGFLASIIIFIGIAWSLEKTVLGERFISSYERTLNAKKIEYMFDHRMGYYVNGWILFKEHPINGIGLRNYPYFNRSFHFLHTEYVVQLTECGLIGVFIFVFFYGHIMKWLLLIRRRTEPYKKIAEMHILSLLLMFTLFFGSWVYNIPMMWVLIAFAVRFIKEVPETSFYNKTEFSK